MNESVETAGITLAYTRQGSGDPVLLLTGLGGQGSSWGRQIHRFAEGFEVFAPDHPGTGSSGRPERASLEHHAEAMAGLIAQMDTGPAHVVGSSTGGAIAQIMALDYPDTVRSITLCSSWARADDYFRHQFSVRKTALLDLGMLEYARTSVLFLFSPEFFRDHYPELEQFVAGTAKGDPEMMASRIDMILEHDQHERLGAIDKPTLVLVGSTDVCTPPHLSLELADAIPGAEFHQIDGGHLIHKEAPDEFHRLVTEFLSRC